MVGYVLIPVINSTGGTDDLNVIILAGQSNAAYSDWPERCNSADVNAVLSAPNKNCLYYGTEETPIMNGTYVSTNTPPSYDTTFESYSIWSMYRSGSWMIGGEEPTLAKGFSNKFDSDVLVINVAVNGQKISELLPTATNGVYAKDVIDHALNSIDRDKYPSVIFSAMVWIQGESDNYAQTPIDDYINDFKKIKSWYETEYGVKNFYISQIRPYFGENATNAQRIIADSYSDVFLTDVALDFSVSNCLMSADNLHYSQFGRNQVGNAISDLFVFSNAPEMRLLYMVPVIFLISIVISAIFFILRAKH